MHQMKLQPLPFSQIKEGSKTIESRLNDEKRQLINIGDQIEFLLANDESQKVLTRVVDLHKFKTFPKLFSSFAPEEFGGKDQDDLMGIYKYYSKEDEEKYGVVGIEIKVL